VLTKNMCKDTWWQYKKEDSTSFPADRKDKSFSLKIFFDL